MASLHRRVKALARQYGLDAYHVYWAAGLLLWLLMLLIWMFVITSRFAAAEPIYAATCGLQPCVNLTLDQQGAAVREVAHDRELRERGPSRDLVRFRNFVLSERSTYECFPPSYAGVDCLLLNRTNVTYAYEWSYTFHPWKWFFWNNGTIEWDANITWRNITLNNSIYLPVGGSNVGQWVDDGEELNLHRLCNGRLNGTQFCERWRRNQS